MKEMPTAILPADSEYVYVPDTDSWIVQKKSGNKMLSKKEANLNPLANLEGIKSTLLKQAIQQQDVVDFYLLSLLPPDYLSGDEIDPEHYDALRIFKTIIQSLRDEYIKRGMDELKDEAETTQWVKAIPNVDMPEEIKPYYKFHDEPFRGSYEEELEEEHDFDFHCSVCGAGLDEYEEYPFKGESYCESCYGEAILQALKSDVFYCTTHHVFVTDDPELKEYLGGKKVDDFENHDGPEHQIIRYKEGEAIWKDVKENAHKQLEFKLRERKKREPKPQPTSMAFPEERQPYTKLPGTQSSLRQAGEGRYLGEDNGWWEAPHNFDNYTSSDFYKIFKYAPWKHMYGGPLWAEVARTINEMEHTTNWQKLMVLIDHFHDLGHNTGKLLDKFPEWHDWFKHLLDMKAQKNSLRYLLQRASRPVRNLVTDYLRVHGKTWKEEEEPAMAASQKALVYKLSKKDKFAFSTIHNVLIICAGNTCRSPMAENILRSIRPDLNVVSRGLYVSKGGPMSPPAEEALKEKGIPFQPHLSKQITESDVNSADLILTMEQYQREELVKLFPQARSKTFLLGSQEIKDPIGGNVEDYKKIRDEIAQALSKMGSLDKLSKAGYGEEAICPSCGEWKPTDFTPAELKEREWECMDCMNKRLTHPEDLPENRGQKEITTFDPEYQWLLKLINVVTKAGVPAQEIKTLSQAHPFVTIDDAGDLAAQIWTLATTKYNIPRDWLIKKLPEKKSSLNVESYEGGWPSENDAVYWGTAPVNTYSDEPNINHDAPTGLREGDDGKPITICPTCKSDKIDKESSPAKCLACGTDFVPKPDRGSDEQTVNDYSQNYFWGPNDLGRSHQNQPGANGWLPAGTEDMDGPSPNVRMSNFQSFMHKQSVLNRVAGKQEINFGNTSDTWFTVLINPSNREAIGLLNKSKAHEIRYAVDEEGTIYIWDSYVGDHYHVLEKLHDMGYPVEYETVPFLGLVNDEENLLKIFKEVDRDVYANLKVAHCGPCSALKMEALHILIDLYYKDNDLFPEEVLEELSVAATELKVDNFNDILESVIEEYLEEKAKEVGDKLPKLKNLLVALKDIAPKLGKEIEVVDKQENVEKEASSNIFEVNGTRVYKNPTPQQAKNIFNNSKKHALRYITVDSDIYMWDAYYAWHREIADGMGVTEKLIYGRDTGNIWDVQSAYGLAKMFVGSSSKLQTANLNKQALEVSPRNPKPLIELKVTFSDAEEPYMDEIVSQMQEVRKKAREADLPFDIESIYKTGFGNELWIDVYASSVEEAVDKINSFFQAAFGQRKQLSSLSSISLRKQANPPSRFWIAPDGKEFDAGTHHGAWIKVNKDLLAKQYGIKNPNVGYAWDALLNNGWVRVSNEPAGMGFQIQVKDLKNLPSFIDDFVARNFSEGNVIEMGDQSSNLVRIYNPFPSLQKAVNRALSLRQMANANLKKASLLDEVLDQTTQDAIASEYGPQMLIALRFYNDGVRYGQSPQRSMEYALEEVKRMHRPIEQRNFLEVLNTYFQG